MIYVCPLALVPETVSSARASHLLSVLESAWFVETPPSILAENHVKIGCHDIIEALEGCVMPSEEHVREIVAFARRWPKEQPLVVHCFAGISRSTSSAFITACVHNPPGRERDLAQAIRKASPTATPNKLIISIADDILGRDGRMVAAIAEIGRGEDAIVAEPFRFEI